MLPNWIARRVAPGDDDWGSCPLSRAGNEIAATCDALQRPGFAAVGLQGISKASQGIVARLSAKLSAKLSD